MRKVYLFFLIGAMSLSVNAQDGNGKVLLPKEDFSKMTAGAEGSPNSEPFSSKSDFPSEYTLTPGWSGGDCYQAGGMIFIGNHDNKCGGYVSGYLHSPDMDLTQNGGHFSVRFRARSTNVNGDEIQIAICDDVFAFNTFTTKITNEWAQYEVACVNTYMGDIMKTHGSIEFAPLGQAPLGSDLSERYTTYIDDIELVQYPIAISTPEVTAPKTISSTSFTATWKPISDATGYKLDVFSYAKEISSTPLEDKSWNMDEVNPDPSFERLINWNNPNFPEGWNINLSEGYDLELVRAGIRTDRYKEGTHFRGVKALAFDDELDYIEIERSESPIRSLTFWVSNLSAEKAGCQLNVEAYYGDNLFNGGRWITITSIDPYTLQKKGQEFDLSDQLPTNTTQIRFTYQCEGHRSYYRSCAIDDINIICGGIDTHERVMLYEDLDTQSTNPYYEVTGLDPNTDYVYRVRSYNENFVSTNSKEQAYKILTSLEAPVSKDIENLTESSFDIAYEPVTYAHNYITDVYLTHTAQKDENYYVAQEDFNSITSGSIENPVQSSYTSEPLHMYTKRGDWRISNAIFANGILGMQNTYASQGNPDQLLSPTWDLSNNNGVFYVKVKAKLEMGSFLYVYLHTTATSKITEEQMAMPEGNGMEEFILTFEKGNETSWLEFVSTAGPVLFDEISVYQPLKKGEVSQGLLYKRVVSPIPSARIFTPDYEPGADMYYYRSRAFSHTIINEENELGLYSPWSEPVQVGNPAMGVTEVSANRNFKAYSDEAMVYVELTEAQMIYIYNNVGMLVDARKGMAGINSFDLKEGLYLIKVEDQVVKVLR